MSSSENTPSVSGRHPAVFFEMLAAICSNVPENCVLDEKDQGKFLALYNVIDLKIVGASRSEMHRNPNSPEGYFSSSYVADENGFDVAQGGYGPPMSVLGSFCHSHETLSFKELHPCMDLSSYTHRLPSTTHVSERRTPSGRTDTNAHRCPPYTPHQRPSSPPSIPPRSPYVIPTITIVDVDAAEQDPYEKNASTATSTQPPQLEVERDEIPESVTIGSIALSNTSPIKADAMEGHSSVEEDFLNNDDSGVAMDDILNPEKDDSTTKDGGIAFSQDSAYATQPFKDFSDEDNELNNVRFSSHSSSPPADASEFSVGEGVLESSHQVRDELAQDAHLSARLGAQFGTPANDTTNVATTSSNPDSASIPTSSLGKCKADSNSDFDDKKIDNKITDTASTSSKSDPASVPDSSLGKRKANSYPNNDNDNHSDNNDDSKGQKPNAKRVKLTKS